jgi:hypothetical protein
MNLPNGDRLRGVALIRPTPSMLGIIKRHPYDPHHRGLHEIKPVSAPGIERECLVAPTKHRLTDAVLGCLAPVVINGHFRQGWARLGSRTLMVWSDRLLNLQRRATSVRMQPVYA